MQNFRSSTTKEESDEQHARILDMVEARDVEGATQALREHIGWNAGDVRQSLPFASKE